jgi:hypothetical protein
VGLVGDPAAVEQIAHGAPQRPGVRQVRRAQGPQQTRHVVGARGQCRLLAREAVGQLVQRTHLSPEPLLGGLLTREATPPFGLPRLPIGGHRDRPVRQQNRHRRLERAHLWREAEAPVHAIVQSAGLEAADERRAGGEQQAAAPEIARAATRPGVRLQYHHIQAVTGSQRCRGEATQPRPDHL